jgi:hypothetical protein
MTERKTLRRATVRHEDPIPEAIAKANAHNEVASIPEARYAAEYISRQIDGRDDFDWLDYAMEHGDNVLLYGPTGPGKTSFILAFAAKKRKRFYSVASNIALDPSQMFGKWGQDENGNFVWYDGGVTDIVRHGGVLLINEVNFLSDRIAPVLYELFDKRREISLLDHKGEKIRAHRPNCWCDSPGENACRSRWVLIVADMNPGYQGTRPLNFALRNRFAIQLPWDYDPNVEAKLVKSQTLLTVATEARKLIGTRLRTPIATNMLQEFQRFANDFDVHTAVNVFSNHFDTEERPIIKGVFDNLMNGLENDFKPDISKGWNQFDGVRDKWLDQIDAIN